MKENTRLILMGLGAGVAANYLLAPSVASATASQPMVAAGAEGVVALGGGYWAWKKKSKVGAIIGGIGAGLLVSSIQGGLLTAPAPPPGKQMGSTPQTGAGASKGSSLPQGGKPPAVNAPSGGIPELPGQVNPGFGSGTSAPPGASIPTVEWPGNPVPGTFEKPTDWWNPFGDYWNTSDDNSGAAVRVGMVTRYR